MYYLVLFLKNLINCSFWERHFLNAAPSRKSLLILLGIEPWWSGTLPFRAQKVNNLSHVSWSSYVMYSLFLVDSNYFYFSDHMIGYPSRKWNLTGSLAWITKLDLRWACVWHLNSNNFIVVEPRIMVLDFLVSPI